MKSGDLTPGVVNGDPDGAQGRVPRRHRKTLAAGAILALVVGLAAHLLHVGHHANHGAGLSTSIYHWLRDSALALPVATLIVYAVNDFSRSWAARGRLTARLRWALMLGLGYAFVLIPGGMAHGRLFPAEAHTGDAFKHALADAVALLPASVYTSLAIVFLFGMPSEAGTPLGAAFRRIRSFRLTPVAWRPTPGAIGRIPVALAAVLTILPAPAFAGPEAVTSLRVPSIASLQMAGAVTCPGGRTLSADVVALDQPFYYNRLGAINANGMMYALARDVVVTATGQPVSEISNRSGLEGLVSLRPDKRPRPLTLRANEGDCLEIEFTNLLDPLQFVFNLPGDFPTGQILGLGVPIGPQVNDQPLTRLASIHVDGLELLGDMSSDGSNVGQNGAAGDGLIAPGDSTFYTYYAPNRGTNLLYSMGSTVGADGGGGTRSYGLFGAVNVEPGPIGAFPGSAWYRSQLTREEMDWAASAWGLDETTGDPTSTPSVGDVPQLDAAGAPIVRLTPDGHPIINWNAVYPEAAGPGKAGLPIVKILNGNEIVHSDLNAIIDDRGFPYPSNAAYPTRGTEPFREFTVIFHDEAFGVQAFPGLYNDPVLKHTLHGVADAFPINYGSGGIGSEIVANRLGVGPMWDCAECKYEEFFLTSFTVGDPAMIVDIPANTTDGAGNIIPGAKATKALYPDDPSNVHHAYLGDRVVFRNLHAGPKEHHIFHLHAHQWQLNPDDSQSNYLDGQALGPGAGYTYEIAYGGSGNRNFTVGDSIFHCHFYPHFAQGMWELWRVHDVFERGTLLDADGRPALGSRALPDGEIPSGTPIPGVVPMPGMAMAPMPDPNATIVSYDLLTDAETGTFGVGNSSQFDADGNGTADINQSFDDFAAPDQAAGALNVDTDGVDGPDIFVDMTNPGYPWFTPGLLGHRPPTPAFDLATNPDVDGDGVDDGLDATWGDGGLPRHIVTSGLDDTEMDVYVSRLDFNKVLHGAAGKQLPEHGTAVEQLAMAFHAGDGDAEYETYFPDGTLVSEDDDGFEVNGLLHKPGAPFADPCRNDKVDSGVVTSIPQNQTIKGANIEMPVTLNKVGWHFQQQRFEALWDDVLPTLNEDRAPQPMIMRLNSTDCAEFWHTNLVPNVYQLDDYQVRTPTDIIGQHIHLVKFDVMSADGAANGWNYEDGTLSPDEVRERIEAFNLGAGFEALDGTIRTELNDPLVAQPHPFFGSTGPDGQDWTGARTTIQRWYADPLLERSWDGGVGTVFTHDHYGPSTHQQVGLYSTLLVEPEGSIWKHNETGVELGTRHDGGPSGWQATIEPGPGGVDFEPHREFYFEFADFQHAYEDEVGAKELGTRLNENLLGESVPIPTFDQFESAVNPSFRLPPPLATLADIYLHPNLCPGGVPRPCPEAISADDPGTYALNFRNEPIALRVFEDANLNGQLDAGEDTNGNGVLDQVAGDAGDLAFAYQSRTDRAIPELNSQPVGPYPPLTADVRPGDPWTPLLRVYQGDQVRIRVQVGAHEEEHNFTIPGLKWKAEPNNPNSGWKNSEFFGIDEYFNLDVPILPDTSAGNPAVVDYVYTVGAELEGMWNGVWGILRSYSRERNDLYELPSNNMGRNGYEIVNDAEFDGICPVGADLQEFAVTAVQAKDVLNKQGEPRGPNPAGVPVALQGAETLWDDLGWLVYNSRETSLTAPAGGVAGKGPLIDPTALLYVMTDDVIFDDAGSPIGLRPGTPVEPLVLRAAAGDCVDVNLKNALPPTIDDMPGFNALPPIVHKNEDADGLGGITSFNANDLRPSSHVGLTAQLLAFDVRDGGFSTGLTTGKLVAPGSSGKYRWYAGDVTAENVGVVRNRAQFRLSAEPVEFGAVGLMSADRIKGSESGFVGAMVIEPAGSTWDVDPDTRTQATVTKADGSTSFRDFVAVMQNDINLRYGGLVEVTDATGAVVQTIDCGLDPSPIECAVPSIAAEGPFGPPEDPQDTGQKAINYGADPLWFRLGVTPDTPFGQLHRNGARIDLADNIPDVFSNSLNLDAAGAVGDPQTPVFRASPAGPDEARFRVVMPGGHARGVSWTIHGHDWQRQPYTNGSREIGYSPTSEWYGVQEGINPTGHWDFVVDLGGTANVTGDYLFRDQASFGSYQGLWGLLRYDQTAPVAVDDAYQTAMNTDLVIGAPGVLANDWDLDGDIPGNAALESAPFNGTVSLNPNGSFTYTPDPGFAGTDSFRYSFTAGGLDSNVATVRITVIDQVLAPVAVDDAYETAVGTELVIGGINDLAPAGVLVNDLAADGGPITAETAVLDTAAAAGPFNGTVSLNPNGSFLYTPDVGFTGTDSFRYFVTDGVVDSNKATVTITVASALVAVDDAYQAFQDQTLNVPAPGVLQNDTYPIGATAALAGDPSAGTVTLNANGSFTYTPGPDFTGTDSFQYSVTAGTDEATATVTIAVVRYQVTIVDALYRTGNQRWRIQGTVTDPLDAVTVYLCPGDTWDASCPVIGEASTNLDGTWSLSTRSNAVPSGSSQVFARSAVGVASAAFTPTIR